MKQPPRRAGGCRTQPEGYALSTLRRKYATWVGVAGLVLGASIGLAATASATTLTCTGTANQITPPLGCGGAQLAYQAKGILDLGALGGNYWNSKVGFLTDSTSASTEDWTVFAVDGSVTDGPGFLGEYVAAYTPDGKFTSFTQGGTKYTNAVPAAGSTFSVGANVYCLSVENLYNGPKGAVRWHTVLRNCNSNGAFTYGGSETPKQIGGSTTPPIFTGTGFSYSNGYNNVINVTFAGGTGINVTGSGVSGNGPSWAIAPNTSFTVTYPTTTPPTGWSWVTDNSVSHSHANAFQVWAPVSGAAGLEMLNESLSSRHGGHFNNTPYVLDDAGFGGSGTGGLAYPENDGLNQQFSIVGCTEPITGLNTSYALCP